MPTLEENPLPGDIGVQIADGRPVKKVKMVGVPNGEDNAYAVNTATDIVPDRRAEQFARVRARTPNKPSTDRIAINPMVQLL